MNFLLQAGVRGQQNLQVLKGGKVVRETGAHKNLILDNMFNDLLSPAASIVMNSNTSSHHVVVGTGSAAPANNQTNLDAYLAGKTGLDVSPVYTNLGITAGILSWKVTRTWTFAESAVTGNITEVGTKNASVPGTLASMALHTRALVLNASQIPTAISVGAGEQLRVIHEFILSFDMTRFSQNFDVTTGGNTTTHLIEMEWCNVTSSAFVNFVMNNVYLRGSCDSRATNCYSTLTFNASYGSPTVTGTVAAASTATSTQVATFTGRVVSTIPSTGGNAAGGVGGIQFGTTTIATVALKATPALPKTSLNKLLATIDYTLARAA